LLALLAAALLAAALLAGCGGGDEPAAPAGDEGLVSDAGPQHVHGLGVDPADGDLYVATHSGLWRAPAGETKAARVGDVHHDLMGFTVAGADSFLASGHPDAQHDLPPQMGLQRSTDGGRSWKTVSLLGEADLHVLRAAGQRLYGVDSGTGALLTSADGGRSWQKRTPPASVLDLAIAPDDAARVVAATEQGLFASTDTGRTWRQLRDDVAGLLAWPDAGALYLVDGNGQVSRSTDGGREFERAGSVGAQPEAFAANGERELYAAVHGGEIVMSGDGGASWKTRSTP
jgi:DNA-binding beta-propeller fold protein YncE